MARSHRIVLRARRLRRDQTEAEKRLWSRLRAGQLNGISFRRQHPVGGFVVDFCAPRQKLIIELDGGQHDQAQAQGFDEARTARLAKLGFRVIRFWNNEVFENLEGVLEEILKKASNLPSP